jgi:ketosteroid isomerase-like protein
MEKFLPATTVFVVILGLLVSFAPVAAQETDPAAVIKAVYDAVAAKDIDSAMALVADDMVLTILPPPRAKPSGTFVGKEEIRNWFEGLAEGNGRAEFSDVTVSGTAATWKARWWGTDFVRLGIAPAEFEGVNIARGGLLRAATWILTEEFQARFQTAMVLETNKKLLTRYMEELWIGGKLELVDEFLSEDFISYVFPAGGREAIKAAVTGFHTDFPNGYFLIDESIVTENKIVIRASMVPNPPPEGKEPEPRDHHILVLSVKDGKITERWIGFIPSEQE